MITNEIHELANKLTDKSIFLVVSFWKEKRKESIDLYNSLVRLGDSKKLACATVIVKQYKNK